LDENALIRRNVTCLRRLRWFPLLACLIAASSGCSLAVNCARDTVFEVRRVTDDCCERVHNRMLANAAWEEVQKSCPQGSASADYASGFKDGYASYLYEGGTDETLPTLPGRYFGVRYQTPEGYQSIQDWFAGYHEGVIAARESGQRDLVIFPVPTWDPDLADYHPYPVPFGSPEASLPGPAEPGKLKKPTPVPHSGHAPDLPPPTTVSPNSPRSTSPMPSGAGPGGPERERNPN
jgi:hypothetical protein